MTVLKEGSSGDDVVRLQEHLKELNFSPGGVDGDFGPATEAAVLAFQRSRGLLADGIVGPRTARALGLGAVLTTQHFFVPGQFEEVINLPKSATLAAIVPVGYPKGRFGTVTRPDPRSTIHWDRYGNTS